MTVGDLKRKLAKIQNEDIEVFVTPLVEADVRGLGENTGKTFKTNAPNMSEQYKLKTVMQIHSLNEGRDSLLLGFDDAVNYGSALERNQDDETDGFIN
jgi:hypothetical protein